MSYHILPNFFLERQNFILFARTTWTPSPPFFWQKRKEYSVCPTLLPPLLSWYGYCFLPFLDSHLHFLVFGTGSHSHAFFAFCTRRRSLPKNIITTITKNRAIYSRLFQQIFYAKNKRLSWEGKRGEGEGGGIRAQDLPLPQVYRTLLQILSHPTKERKKNFFHVLREKGCRCGSKRKVVFQNFASFTSAFFPKEEFIVQTRRRRMRKGKYLFLLKIACCYCCCKREFPVFGFVG